RCATPAKLHTDRRVTPHAMCALRDVNFQESSDAACPSRVTTCERHDCLRAMLD
ncbi:hypothetical protein HAX54_005648, partial [Datura stramonium]|nr:hypothetical protein [Datura stramonium]